MRAVQKCAAMDSRGAATECSPGRKPGVFFRDDLSPAGAKDSFALRGWCTKTTPTPGLRPGLHSVAAPRLNTGVGFSASSLEKVLTLITTWTGSATAAIVRKLLAFGGQNSGS